MTEIFIADIDLAKKVEQYLQGRVLSEGQYPPFSRKIKAIYEKVGAFISPKVVKIGYEINVPTRRKEALNLGMREEREPVIVTRHEGGGIELLASPVTIRFICREVNKQIRK